MAWGKKTPPPPSSSLRYCTPMLCEASHTTNTTSSKLLPLIVLFVVLAGAAFVGYHLYLAFTQISSAANEKLQSKNVVFTKDGMKVGVKEIKNENYVDKTQNILVKAWNLSTWPEYKSRLWNKQQADKDKDTKARKP